MRQDFQLPLEDVRFLTRLGLPWETVLQGSERWVLIHEHPLPDGYNQVVVTIAILISGGYRDRVGPGQMEEEASGDEPRPAEQCAPALKRHFGLLVSANRVIPP